MRKIAFLLLTTTLMAGTVYAGSSLFKHKKSSNPYGVNAINLHICSELECPEVRIVSGDCNGEHMEMQYGVCLCEEGYVANGTTCTEQNVVQEPQSTIDGWTADENQNCDTASKPGPCSVCLSIENTVGENGKNEFWADSNTLCGQKEICLDGTCQAVSGSGCVKNSDCANKLASDNTECGTNGCYCSYNKPYSDENYPTNTGTCKPNNNFTEFFYGTDNKRYIAVRTLEDVWSSKNFCESLNMRLMGWNELECTIVGNTVTLGGPDSPIQKAASVIYGDEASFSRAFGYTTDYALIQIAHTFGELYSTTNNLFFFCR